MTLVDIVNARNEAYTMSQMAKNAEEVIYNSEILTSELRQYDDFRLLEKMAENEVKGN